MKHPLLPIFIGITCMIGCTFRVEKSNGNRLLRALCHIAREMTRTRIFSKIEKCYSESELLRLKSELHTYYRQILREELGQYLGVHGEENLLSVEWMGPLVYGIDDSITVKFCLTVSKEGKPCLLDLSSAVFRISWTPASDEIVEKFPNIELPDDVVWSFLEHFSNWKLEPEVGEPPLLLPGKKKVFTGCLKYSIKGFIEKDHNIASYKAILLKVESFYALIPHSVFLDELQRLYITHRAIDKGWVFGTVYLLVHLQ